MQSVLLLEKSRQVFHFENLALTEINICALCSQLNKHNEAVQHALLSIKILESAVDKELVLHFDENKEIDKNLYYITYDR